MLCGDVGRLLSLSNEPLARMSVGEAFLGNKPDEEPSFCGTKPISERVSIGTLSLMSEDLRTADVSIVMVGARGRRPGIGDVRPPL